MSRVTLDHLIPAGAWVRLNEATGRTHRLPVVLYAPTSRCNSRCISCDWWRSDGRGELSVAEVERVADDLVGLGTRLVVFTGGEPLLRKEVFELADLFRSRGITLHLLTSGLALEKHAEDVASRFVDVTVSLDGHDAESYRRIRGVAALEAVERGVRKLSQRAPEVRIRARSTLHRHNYAALPLLIEKALDMGLHQVSFLSADVGPASFGRGDKPADQGLLLDAGQVAEFTALVERVLVSHRPHFDSGFVAERGDRLRRLPRYYAAHLGLGPFPRVACNAPWASAVVESTGAVRPCFFMPPVGNVRDRSLRELLALEMPAFRRGLDVASDQTCQRCVCTLNVGVRERLG